MGAESIRAMRPLFQAEESGSIPTSALCLTVEPISCEQAKKLNALWHSTLPRLGTGFIKRQPFLCYAATFGGLAYAVAIWSNPVARALPQREWLELRRLAVAPDAPRNTASRMLAVMARLVRAARPEVKTLVSYQDTQRHTGGIYRAAGWTPTTLATRKNWSSPARRRPEAQRPVNKQRWEKWIGTA